MLPCSHPERVSPLFLSGVRQPPHPRDARSVFLYGISRRVICGKERDCEPVRPEIIGYISLESERDQLGSVSERWCGFHPFLM